MEKANCLEVTPKIEELSKQLTTIDIIDLDDEYKKLSKLKKF